MSDMYILGVAKKPWFTVGKHHHHYFSGGLLLSIMIHSEPVFWQDPLYNHDVCCFSISFFFVVQTLYMMFLLFSELIHRRYELMDQILHPLVF